MLKKIAAFILFVQLVFIGFAQNLAKSPEQFLGYKLGSRYSPHFRIVNYYKHVAETMPSTVKLEQYGETNEGRPLLLAYIASAENLARLDAIRTNNLRLAGI